MLFLDVNIITVWIILKMEISSLILSILPFIFPWWRPQHVAYIRNKWMLENWWGRIGLIKIEDLDLVNTTGWFYSKIKISHYGCLQDKNRTYVLTESSCLYHSCFVYDGRFSTLRLCHHRCLLQNLWLLQIHFHVWFRTMCLCIVVTNVVVL